MNLPNSHKHGTHGNLRNSNSKRRCERGSSWPSALAILELMPGELSVRYLRWTPHPAMVTITDNRDYIRVLLYSYYTTITGWGVLLKDTMDAWV